jgi:hypothetical protein
VDRGWPGATKQIDRSEAENIFRPKGFNVNPLHKKTVGEKMLNLLSTIVLILAIWALVVLLVPN